MAVLVKSSELGTQGARDFVFCTLDGDLVPIDRKGEERKELKLLYEKAGITVRKDFAVL